MHFGLNRLRRYNDACTDDSCDSQTGCEHTPVDCDAGDFCQVYSCNNIILRAVIPLLLIVAMTTFAQKTPATQNQQSVNILLLIAMTIMRVLWIVVAQLLDSALTINLCAMTTKLAQ
jgi:hypothetical protein